MTVNEKDFTSELKKIILLSNRILNEQYPTPKLSIEHFVLALLENKTNSAYKLLSKILTSKEIQYLTDYHSKQLHSKVSDLNLNKKVETQIVYDKTLTDALNNSIVEKDLLKDTKISTDHVLLSILTKENTTQKIFNNVNITYESLFNKIQDNKNETLNRLNQSKEVVESISANRLKPSNKNVIETYTVNLNQLAKNGKIDKLIGREDEIKRIVKILGRRTRSNIILVGTNGCGKTHLVYGLADLIEENKASFLNGKTILLLDMTALIAGTIYRGQLEDRINQIINHIKQNKEIILFVDDIHNVLGNSSNNASEIGGMLSNALSNNEIQLIATTSYKEYKNSIEKNSTLSRRFQKVIVEPTTVEETENILSNSKTYYEQYHNVAYTDDAIKACVYLANKYITDRHLPDSAIDIMDECGSDKKVYSPNLDELLEFKKELKLTEELRDKAMKVNDFKLGDEYNRQCNGLKTHIIDCEKKLKGGDVNNRKEITDHDVYHVVSQMSGIPLTKLSSSEKQRYLEIENILKQNLIGQDEAIKIVSQTVKRGRLGIGRKNKPIGIMLFAGSSGCGKTLAAKKLAEEIFGNESHLVKFDMSEYSDKASVSKLIGGSPQYIGYEAGGLLTEAIKNKKHCVLLLDEIEKADPDIFNVFLQVFEDGYLHDGQGEKISFKNTIIIMTSNIGIKEAEVMGGGIGFTTNPEEKKKNTIEKALRGKFPPEFINRIDNIVYFNNLNDENLKDIIKLELNNLNKRLSEINFSMKYQDENIVIEYLFEKMKKNDNEKGMGARPINRVIQQEIEDNICDLYMENDYEKDHVFEINVVDNKLEIK